MNAIFPRRVIKKTGVYIVTDLFMLSINSNNVAITVARNLNNVYKRLAKSTERLSSGLRINSSADDAAGLAIREMMRSDIHTLDQGIRNASDAISLINTAEGALAVIDEKLIRMKELAEHKQLRGHILLYKGRLLILNIKLCTRK